MNQHHHECLGAAALELAGRKEIKEYFPDLTWPPLKARRVLQRKTFERKQYILECALPDRGNHIKIRMGYGIRDLTGIPALGKFSSFEHFAIPRGHIEDNDYRIEGYCMAKDESLGELDDWASMTITIRDIDHGPLNRCMFPSALISAYAKRSSAGWAAHFLQDSCCWHHVMGVLLWGHSPWEQKLWNHYHRWIHRNGELDIERLVPYVIGQLDDSMLTGDRTIADIIAANVTWIRGYMQHDTRREQAMEGEITAEVARGICARALAATIAGIALWAQETNESDSQ